MAGRWRRRARFRSGVPRDAPADRRVSRPREGIGCLILVSLLLLLLLLAASCNGSPGPGNRLATGKPVGLAPVRARSFDDWMSMIEETR